MNTIVNNIKSFYGQIDAIKARAQLALSQGGGSMFGGVFGGDKGN